MTPEEYNERLTQLHGLVSGDLAEDVILVPALELLAAIRLRISAEGKNSADGNIGSYSTKPIYVEPKVFIKGGFKAGRKADKEAVFYGQKQVKKSVNKTMYLPEGYKELRDIQGLRTDIMNFKYSGDLLQSYQAQKFSQYVVLGLTEEKSVLKRGGLERRFGPVFYATDQEKERYIKKVNFLLARITRNTIAGYDVTGTID